MAKQTDRRHDHSTTESVKMHPMAHTHTHTTEGTSPSRPIQ